MTFNTKNLNTKNVAGLALLTLMVGLAVWAIQMTPQHHASHKANIVVVEGL